MTFLEGIIAAWLGNLIYDHTVGQKDPEPIVQQAQLQEEPKAAELNIYNGATFTIQVEGEKYE